MKLLSIVGCALIVTALAARATCAEQVVVHQVEYSNDSISNGGKTVICVVTMVALALPDPRSLNFQFLVGKGVSGWKITGGLLDTKSMSWKANRVADGEFSSSTFNHDQDFKKQLTPEGQLVGWLMNPSLFADFFFAFDSAPYSVRVRWAGTDEDVTYYIDQPPDQNVRSTLRRCHAGM